MYFVRRIFRWSFTLGGLFFLRMGLSLYAQQHEAGADPSLYDALLPILCLFATFVFTLAWWSTRRANRDAPKPWALVASAINVIYGAVLLMLQAQNSSEPITLSSPLPGIIALGIAGILLFRPRSAPAKVKEDAPSEKAAKPKRIAGDRTSAFGDRVFEIVSLVAQFAALWMWRDYAWAHRIRLFHSPYSYVIAIAAGLFATTIHECGHTLVGLLLHMKLVSFETGPFRWYKAGGTWKFKVTAEKFLSLGGAAGLLPASPADPQWREALMVVAGPVGSLLTGLVFLQLALHTHPLLWQFFACTASAGLTASLLNLMPLRLRNGGYSDGAHLLQLATSSPFVEYKRVAKLIRSTEMTPLRPRAIDEALVRRAIEATDAPELTLSLRIFLTEIYSDRNARAQARASFLATEALIRDHQLEVPEKFLSSMTIDAARFRRDPATTQMWWERLRKARPTPQSFHEKLAEVASLWMQHDLEEARGKCLKLRQEAQRLHACGATDVRRDLCASLLREIEQAIVFANLKASPDGVSECSDVSVASPVIPESQRTGQTIVLAAATEGATPSKTVPYSPERRRWPRTSETPGRNMWPRPNVTAG